MIVNNEISQQYRELEEEIKKLGYESLRYSLLKTSNENLEDWQNRIDFENEKYFVYATMDRASIRGKYEFNEFKTAEKKFIELLDLTVKSNQLRMKNNMPIEYSSPLWDNYRSRKDDR